MTSKTPNVEDYSTVVVTVDTRPSAGKKSNKVKRVEFLANKPLGLSPVVDDMNEYSKVSNVPITKRPSGMKELRRALTNSAAVENTRREAMVNTDSMKLKRAFTDGDRVEAMRRAADQDYAELNSVSHMINSHEYQGRLNRTGGGTPNKSIWGQDPVQWLPLENEGTTRVEYWVLCTPQFP